MMKLSDGIKSCVIPSLAEIFTVSGVEVGIGVIVACGVAVNGIDVGVAIGTSITVGAGSVYAL